MKERPICRKAILRLCEKYDCSIQDLLDNKYAMITSGLKLQARKMIIEGMK